MGFQLTGFRFDFIGRMGAMLWISAVLMVGSVVLLATRGLNLGTDFAGGYEVQVTLPAEATESNIASVLSSSLGLEDVRVQRYGAVQERTHLILVRHHTTLSKEHQNAVRAEMETLAGGADKLLTWAVAESGETVHVGFTSEVSEEAVRKVFEKFPVKIKSIRKGDRSDRPEYTLECVSLADRIEASLRDAFHVPAQTAVVSKVEFVGPQVGEQLRNQGIMAVLYAMGFILIYIAVRFDFYFSPGAILSLLHDVVITLGFFALFQYEFNLSVVAAILTLVGYSLNDTIVVYDRVRENVLAVKGKSLRVLVNTALNETLSRTLLTGVTTMLVVASLLIFGGGGIRDFSVAMLVGVIIGTYSSIAVASPTYILVREYVESRTKTQGKGSSSGSVSSFAA
jgi:preprotein translocase subunit SecF